MGSTNRAVRRLLKPSVFRVSLSGGALRVGCIPLRLGYTPLGYTPPKWGVPHPPWGTVRIGLDRGGFGAQPPPTGGLPLSP